MTKIVEITEENFEEVVNGDKPVLLDFWAPWCGPCKMVLPLLEEIANERDDVIIAKCNVDQVTTIAPKYGVRGIPTMLIFKDGKVSGTKVGAAPKAALDSLINDNI